MNIFSVQSGVTSDAKQSSETSLYRLGSGLALSVGLSGMTAPKCREASQCQIQLDSCRKVERKADSKKLIINHEPANNQSRINLR